MSVSSKITNAASVTDENHTMLVQLNDSVSNIGQTLSGFIKAQSEENLRIHTRIDAQAENMTKAVGSIKDTISDRGRITPALVAMVLSSVAILGGAFAAYIGLQTAPIKTDIMNVSREIATAEGQRLQMRQNLIDLQVKSAGDHGQLKENLKWIEMALCDFKTKNSK